MLLILSKSKISFLIVIIVLFALTPNDIQSTGLDSTDLSDAVARYVSAIIFFVILRYFQNSFAVLWCSERPNVLLSLDHNHHTCSMFGRTLLNSGLVSTCSGTNTIV